MNRYQADVAAYDALPSNPPASSVLLLTPPVKKRDSVAVVYEDIAAEWTAASLLMHDMLSARGVPYLHVLQPNQYFTSRAFSSEEARVALNDATPFKQSVSLGYPVLERATAALTAGEQFLDGTTAFDRERAAVYEDDCCHYTDRGYEILAEVIASRVREMKRPAGRARAIGVRTVSAIDVTDLEPHRAALTGHCYRMLGSAFDAEDAVQETMVRAWKGLSRFDGRASLRTWLYRIATNVCLDALAAQSRRARPIEEGPVGTVDDELETRPRTHWLEPMPDARLLPSDADPFETGGAAPEHAPGVRGGAAASAVEAARGASPRRGAWLVRTGSGRIPRHVDRGGQQRIAAGARDAGRRRTSPRKPSRCPNHRQSCSRNMSMRSTNTTSTRSSP